MVRQSIKPVALLVLALGAFAQTDPNRNVPYTPGAWRDDGYTIRARDGRDMQIGGSVAITGTVLGANVNLTNRSVVLLGDSITAYNAGGAGVTYPSMYGYWDLANEMLGQRFQMIHNAGVAGETTAQMLARLTTDVIAYSPAWCVVMAGINDVENGVASATTIANLKAIYQALNQHGIGVIAATITPRSTFTTTAKKAAWTSVNQWIREYSRTANNFRLVDTAIVYLDATNTTGPIPLSGYTSDGTHPSPSGAFVLGKAFYDALKDFPPVGSTLLWNSDPLNLLVNGMLTGSGTLNAGVTGTVPASPYWNVWAQSGASCVSGSTANPGGGQTITLTITGSGATSNCLLTQLLSNTLDNKTVVLEVEILGGTVTQGFRAYVFNGTGSVTYWAHYSQPGDSALGQTLPYMLLRSTPITIGSGSNTSVNVMLLGASGSLQIGRISLREVITP